MSAQRILVFGCGGIGGNVAARLHEDGHAVVVVTHNEAITAAVAQRGLIAETTRGTLTARVDVVTAPEGAAKRGRFDVAFLAVPPNRVAAAAEAAVALLDDDGLLVPLANGLPEEPLAARYGDARVVGGVVGFGAAQKAPGHVEMTSDGGILCGRWSGDVDADVHAVAGLVAGIGGDGTSLSGDHVTSNLRGARYSKLAINAAISSLGTIGGDTLGSLMRHRYARRLCLEVMTEAVQTAQKQGVQLEKLANTIDLDWLALDDEERTMAGSPSLFAKHTVLLAVGARYRRLRSSMLAAIERGREPPVEFLNGEVVRRGKDLGVRTPVNEAVTQMVQAIARGEKTASTATLEALFDETRTTLRALHMA